MENFESLNSIFDEFKMKKTTLSIFRVDSLYRLGKEFSLITALPEDLSRGPVDIKFDYTEDAFCSIFSDSDQRPHISTQTCTSSVSETKLKFEEDVLSSDFIDEPMQPILTSAISD